MGTEVFVDCTDKVAVGGKGVDVKVGAGEVGVGVGGTVVAVAVG